MSEFWVLFKSFVGCKYTAGSYETNGITR